MVSEKFGIHEMIDDMDLDELKKAILGRINRVNDIETLKGFLKVVDELISRSVIFTPTDEQMKRLEEADADIEKASILPKMKQAARSTNGSGKVDSVETSAKEQTGNLTILE